MKRLRRQGFQDSDMSNILNQTGRTSSHAKDKKKSMTSRHEDGANQEHAMRKDGERHAMVRGRERDQKSMDQGVDESQKTSNDHEMGKSRDQKLVMCRDARLHDVIVLPRGTDLHKNVLLYKGMVVIQDWASCLPAHVLSSQGRRRFNVVVDACAAPGNKATHIQALALEPAGMVIAVERDQKRAQTLSDTAHRVGADRIVVVNHDWLSLDPQQEPQRSAEAILVDPSCSGSQTENSLPPQRVATLAAFQTKALLRALSYPKVRVVVYSTCSVDRMENENVVQHALASFKDDFVLEECLPWWPHRGLDDTFAGAKMCVRTDAWRDHTQGFFVACFVRKVA